MHKTVFLPYSANIRLRVEADSLEELFVGGLEALGTCMKADVYEDVHSPEIMTQVETGSVNTSALFVDFLTDVLILTLQHRVVFCRLQVFELNEKHIHAAVTGKKVERFDKKIRTLAYHDTEVEKHPNGSWITHVVMNF